MATPTASQQIRAFVERIERLHEERDQIADDIKDIYTEAKGNGFDVKALKEVIARRRKDPAELTEHEAIVETYMAALGTGPATRARAGLGALSPTPHADTADAPFQPPAE